MLKVTVQNHQLHFGEHFAVSFQRTLRIPDDDNTYPLPPGLGMFPVCKVEDYGDRVPASWRQHGGVFIPMYQREALWLNFQAAHWRPNAVKVAIGKVNAITGKPWEQELHDDPQDYLVCPTQPWLDGINAGDGYIRQFVAMPLGMGYTVEAQVTGKEEFGGIQMIVFEPKPGRFPDQPPAIRQRMMALSCAPSAPMAGAEMGLGAGGKMRQKIYPDKHGLDTWDVENYGRVYVHIVNSMMYREIAGKEPPKTPITAKTYTQYGFPWFDLYDEQEGDVSQSTTLSQVKTIKGMDQEKGFSPQQDDTPIEVSESQVKVLKSDPTLVEDGEW
jgi:hypothetical protein